MLPETAKASKNQQPGRVEFSVVHSGGGGHILYKYKSIVEK